MREGVERFGKWFGRKGWFGFSPSDTSHGEGSGLGGNGNVEGVDVNGQVADGNKEKLDIGRLEEEVEKRWNVSESGGKILVEVATAYAITKVFLPARIVLSVWGTPWFARVVLGRFGGLFRRRGANVVTKPGQ